jgi:uncharacterized protein DUF1206
VISGAPGSQTKKQQDLTATVMHHAGGRWLVGIVGLIIVIAGLALVFEGIRAKFMKYLQLSQLSPRTRRLVKWLGVTGTAARGVVFALAGALVIEAAVSYQPSKAGGLHAGMNAERVILAGHGQKPPRLPQRGGQHHIAADLPG